MNLQTQNVYIPVKNDEGTHLQKHLAGMMEKRSGVIILTPEELNELKNIVAEDTRKECIQIFKNKSFNGCSDENILESLENY